MEEVAKIEGVAATIGPLSPETHHARTLNTPVKSKGQTSQVQYDSWE